MREYSPSNLTGKKILVTAGSTWVPIDDVRVITNIFGGKLGICIAEEAVRMGAEVTLLLGPGRSEKPKASPLLNIVDFKYYEELLELVTNCVGTRKFDVVINSAAVSDYTPVDVFKGKIKSTLEEMTINLKKTIKIVDIIKKIDSKILLVKFKLEVGLSKSKLIDVARDSMNESCADIMVANDFTRIGLKHNAYIMDTEGYFKECNTKSEIASDLMKLISTKINHA